MGTRDTWLDEESPAGGVGTITRPGTDPAAEPGVRRGRARPAPLAPTAPPARVPPRRAAPPGKSPAPGTAADRVAARGLSTQRMPFFLVLCVLLGGALISALVISTTLAEGTFQISRLQQANSALARQRQMLQEQVAAAQSAQVIEQHALQLGMRPVGELRFLDLKNGRVETDAGRGANANIDVPGYTP